MVLSAIGASICCESSLCSSFLPKRKPKPLWIWECKMSKWENKCMHPSSSSLNDTHSGHKNSDIISDSPLWFHSGIGFEPGTCQVFLCWLSEKNIDLLCVRRMRWNWLTCSTVNPLGIMEIFPLLPYWTMHVLFVLCPSHHEILSVVDHIFLRMPIKIHAIPFSTISPSQFCQPLLCSLKLYIWLQTWAIKFLLDIRQLHIVVMSWAWTEVFLEILRR